MSSTTAPLANALQARFDNGERLSKLEAEIYDQEEVYLQSTQGWGNIFRGFDGYLSSKTLMERKSKKIRESDRQFSSSSCTAPHRTVEAGMGHRDEDPDQAQASKRKKYKARHTVDGFGSLYSAAGDDHPEA